MFKLLSARKREALFLGLGLGVFYWIIDSFTDAFLFHEGTFVSLLIAPSPHEIWMRLLTISVLIFGLLALYMVIKHKRAEERLKASSLQWQITFDAIKDGIFIADAKGKILRCNKAFADFVNSTESEIVGRICHEVMHGTADFMDECPFVSAKVTRHREVTELKTGNKWLYVTVDPILNDSGEVVSFVHAVSDITKRKQAEEELRKSEENLKLYQALINQSNDSVEVLDPETGHFLNVNNKTCSDLGYSREELLSMKVFDIDPIVKPSDFPKIVEDLKRTGGGIWNGIHLRKDGSTFPVEVSLKLVQLDRSYLVAVARDITERNKMQEQLFQITHDWEDTFNTITDMITIHDTDFNIIHANKAAEKILGLPILNVSPSKCYKYYHGTGGPPEGCPSCECLKTGMSSINEIYEPHLKMFIEIRAIPRFDSNHNLTGLIHVVRDITERRKLEDQLRQSQKMEAIGQLAGGIAHDFNNILTAVIGYATILKMRMGMDDPLKVNLDQILTASEKGANLTQSLLAFSRQQISNPEPVNVNELIRNMEKLLLRVIGEDVELRTILAGDLTVMADRGQIDQVLINLCTNARDAMPDGGVLTIETGLMELDKDFTAAYDYGKPGTYAVITVADTGTGMDEKIREKIFEPFFTTKEVGKGTGLGLSIVYGIIKQHNGYISCNSGPGKGSTFRIYLPISKLEVTETHSEEMPEIESQTATVLLAEDELSVRKLTKQILENFGYSVIEAADGEEAVKRFIENKDRIDMIILDVIMPKINGKEVYDRIRKIRPGIKALLTSGYPADFIQKQEITKQGINFMAKPVSPAGLIKKVKEELAK